MSNVATKARREVEERVECDGCGAPVDFDPAIAKLTRACGGTVRCEHCEPTSVEGEPLS